MLTQTIANLLDRLKVSQPLAYVALLAVLVILNFLINGESAPVSETAEQVLEYLSLLLAGITSPRTKRHMKGDPANPANLVKSADLDD